MSRTCPYPIENSLFFCSGKENSLHTAQKFYAKTRIPPKTNRKATEENRIKRDSNSIFSLQMDIARLQTRVCRLQMNICKLKMEFVSRFAVFFSEHREV